MAKRELGIMFRGYWNGSNIGLDLGKRHSQVETLEHSRLEFTAAGAAKDFFHTFSNFISEKNILSTLFSYAALAIFILILIIILPCSVKTLRQNTEKLATELHLAVLRNKKKRGGDMPGATMGNPTHDKVM